MRLLRTIILEGADGSGKSKLFDRMTKKWGLKSAGHDGGPPTSPAEVWKRLAMTAAMSPAIRDRSPCVSGIVYPLALEREQMVSTEELCLWIQEFRPFIIYCAPPSEVILSSVLKAKAHKKPEFVEQISGKRTEIINAYEDTILYLSSKTNVDVQLYDWTVDQLGKDLLQNLRRRRVICAG